MRSKARKHLLLIEDDDDLRDAFEQALARDFEVTAVGSGPGARRYLAREGSRAVDCVITDLRMPELGGLELIELLRRSDRAVPIVVVTGYADEQSFSRARDLDVHARCSPSR